MTRRSRQEGVTLVVALVMLVVLTVLVVSVVRFGNINLKISGNMQAETEAQAAAQVALERTVNAINASPNISAISAQPTMAVSTGAVTYTVSVTKPACIFTKNIHNSQLDPSKAGDLPCFENIEGEKLVTSNNTLTQAPTACKDQQWDVEAEVNDSGSGARTALLQGVSVRVGAEVLCP
jgi:Tfp pilus assembly protein PilX